ncbi:MAG: hypothetical protein RR425_06510, partial [Erysipelotrichales bacterium]
MKVNDSLLVLSLSNALQSTSSLTKSIELIYHLNLINEEKYHKILSSLKEEYSIMQILLILEIDKSLIQYTLFYNNYYSLAISLKMSSSIVSEIKSFKSEIISSLIYPTILIILSFIALLFVSNFI